MKEIKVYVGNVACSFSPKGLKRFLKNPTEHHSEREAKIIIWVLKIKQRFGEKIGIDI